MNIVQFDQFRNTQKRFSRDDSIALLQQCRTLFGERVAKVFSAMMVKVDDALFELSEKDTSVQSAYFESMRDLRQQKDSLKVAFLQGVSNAFNEALIPFGFMESIEKKLKMELSLVDEDEQEQVIAIQDMKTKLEMLCHKELYALNYRFGELLESDRLATEQNPLSPQRVCQAFQQACSQINLTLRVRLVVFKLFDRHVISAGLLPIYQEVDRLLIKNEVLPELPEESIVNPQTDGQEDDRLYAELQKMILGGEQPPTKTQVAGVNSLLGALSGMQQGSVEGLQSQGIEIDQTALLSGMINVVRQIQEQGAGQNLNQADSTAIDVVAMLFDYILEDKNLPDAMKAQIGRLQIPVLKIALTDKNFFARRRHPARRLLNAMSSASIGWDESLGHDDALYQKVESTTQFILDEYNEQPDAFEKALQGFEQFLSVEQKKVAQQAEQAARLAQNQERLKAAKIVVAREIETRLQKRGVPEAVQDFINTYWRSHLLVTYVKQTDGSIDWKKSLVTMDNLVWSVTPKTTEERPRLIKMLPSLLQAIMAGMEYVSMPQQERDNFLAKLAGCHGQIVNGASQLASQLKEQGSVHDYLASPGAAAPTPIRLSEAADKAEEGTIQKLIEEGEVDIEEVTLSSEEPAEEVCDVMDFKEECIRQVESLQVGDWMELKNGDGNWFRAKLTWVSPVTGRYMFTNRKGMKVADRTMNGLIMNVQCGDARLIDDQPVLERAVDCVVNGLSRQTA